MKIVHSTEDLRVVAKEVASTLIGGEVLGLSGPLGAGKTEFVRGLVGAFGSKDSVKSPSFTLLNQYRLEHARIKHLIHVDLYRLQETGMLGKEVFSEIGLDEWLDRSDTVVAIEWPERLKDVGVITMYLHFDYGEKEDDRVIEIKTRLR